MEIQKLALNESPFNEADIRLLKEKGERRRWPKSPFPVDQLINEKVVIYLGDYSNLKAEAFVNPSNESLTQLDSISHLAGPELKSYIKQRNFNCVTGGVIVTPGFKSNYAHILHAVPPKYQPKYKTAAESALFHTYFRLLETLITKGIRSVVMPTLSTPKCNLPFKENFHLQLRIIRRMLEKKLSHFDRIVIPLMRNEVMVDDEALANEQQQQLEFFYYYFPRNWADEELACYKFEASIGGPNGEPVIPEREIRIKGKPARLNEEASIDLTSGLDLSTVVGKTPFSRMRGERELEQQQQQQQLKHQRPQHHKHKQQQQQLQLQKQKFHRACCII